MEEDIFQKRYLEHQDRKKQTLEDKIPILSPKSKYSIKDLSSFLDIMMNRRSQRIFTDLPIHEEDLNAFKEAVRYAPSSCNRQAIYLKEVNSLVIEQYLVGGKNWINKANKVLLLFANKEAYKSPNEKSFMPFLDAGFVAQNIYLLSEALELGCCFVNPNIREENKLSFIDLFGNDYFCGAIALGHYDKKAVRPPHRDISEVLKK